MAAISHLQEKRHAQFLSEDYIGLPPILVRRLLLGHWIFWGTLVASRPVSGSAVQPADRAVEAVQTASSSLESLPHRVPARRLVSYYRDGPGGQCRDRLMKTKRTLAIVPLVANNGAQLMRNQMVSYMNMIFWGLCNAAAGLVHSTVACTDTFVAENRPNKVQFSVSFSPFLSNNNV